MNGAGNIEITLIYLIGTFSMVVLAGAVLFFFTAYQKRLLKKELEINLIKSNQQEEILKTTILSQEKERKRIAQDLHDEVGAMLSVVKLNVAMFERKTNDEKSKLLAAETKSYLDDIILQVRRISRSLMPPSLERLGLNAAIEELVDWINKTGEIHVCYRNNSQSIRLENEKELAVFRIVQELLNNAIKHSEASRIEVLIRNSMKMLVVIVHDNGKGFKNDELTKTGLGLQNLKSRTQILNAKYKIKSAPGKGTNAILCLNTQPDSHE